MRISVPPSATPHGAVEWFEPTARTGEGYFAGFFITSTMSATELASTIIWGWETTSPNQLATSRLAISDAPIRLRAFHG